VAPVSIFGLQAAYPDSLSLSIRVLGFFYIILLFRTTELTPLKKCRYVKRQ
jgi:hypothetical protein